MILYFVNHKVGDEDSTFLEETLKLKLDRVSRKHRN